MSRGSGGALVVPKCEHAGGWKVLCRLPGRAEKYQLAVAQRIGYLNPTEDMRLRLMLPLGGGKPCQVVDVASQKPIVRAGAGDWFM